MKTAIIIIIALLIVGSVLFLRNIATNGERALQNDSLALSNNLPQQYLSLFKWPDKIKISGVNKSKWRKPIADLIYNGKYFLEVYQIPIDKGISLKRFITESYHSEHISYGQYYNTIMDNKPHKLSINYRSGDPGTIDQIHFNIYGDNAKAIIRNDSLCYYTANLDGLSVSYTNDGPQEIYISKGDVDNAPRIPIQVAFYKRGADLFFILLNSSEKDAGALPALLKI